MADKADFKTSEDAPKAVSRRNFIKGVVTSGVAVSSASYLFRASTLLNGQQVAAGVGERLITLNVNGQQRRVDVMKQETLASTLRYKLGLTGTKLGCDRAECGSCTVLIDDIPHYACSVLTHTVRGRKVLTIEGLANPDGTLTSGSAGRDRRTGVSVCFLHARLHYGYRGVSENRMPTPLGRSWHRASRAIYAVARITTRF